MDVAQIDISAFTDEDLARMMSVLSVDLSHDVGWIAGSLPDILPDSDLQIRIDLPNWVRSTSGNPSNLILDVAEETLSNKLVLKEPDNSIGGMQYA